MGPCVVSRITLPDVCGSVEYTWLIIVYKKFKSIVCLFVVRMWGRVG